MIHVKICTLKMHETVNENKNKIFLAIFWVGFVETTMEYFIWNFLTYLFHISIIFKCINNLIFINIITKFLAIKKYIF